MDMAVLTLGVAALELTVWVASPLGRLNRQRTDLGGHFGLVRNDLSKERELMLTAKGNGFVLL